MKKRFALWLAVLMLCSLAGCGAESSEPTDAPEATTTTESAAASTTTTKEPETSATQKPTKPSVAEPSESKFPLTLTVEKYMGEGAMYRDVSVAEVNYSLKLTANTDLKQLRLLEINPDTSKPEKALHTLTALKKGESQYLLTYVNDATPNRGVLCTDTKGNTRYYILAYSGSGQGNPVYLQEIRP